MKVRVIKRVKPEEAPEEVQRKQAGNEAVPSSAKKTSKRAERERREAERWQKGHPGLRRVYFVIDTELWDRFMASCCTTHRPNDVFTRMIYEVVQAKMTLSGKQS